MLLRGLSFMAEAGASMASAWRVGPLRCAAMPRTVLPKENTL